MLSQWSRKLIDETNDRGFLKPSSENRTITKFHLKFHTDIIQPLGKWSSVRARLVEIAVIAFKMTTATTGGSSWGAYHERGVRATFAAGHDGLSVHGWTSELAKTSWAAHDDAFCKDRCGLGLGNCVLDDLIAHCEIFLYFSCVVERIKLSEVTKISWMWLVES